MATQTEGAAPELTIVSRIAAIPLVASSLSSIHETLTNNTYTRTPYSTAQGLSKSALSYTEPLQRRLAPLLVRADGYANKGLDAVESRYPYPFKTPTEDIVKDIKGHSDHAYDVANKTVDEKVRSPALNVAQGIDQRFAPIVDYFEGAVHKIHANGTNGSAEPSSPDVKYQYQRAYALSKELSDQLYVMSSEQIAQIKEQNVLVQRASHTAQSISATASSSYGAAQEKVHALSDTMLAELQKIQTSTAKLPASLQASFHDISTHLSATVHDLSVILKSPAPLQEKVHKVRDTVQDRVHPVLEAATVRVQEILGVVRPRTDVKENGVQEPAPGANGAAAVNGILNGNGH